MSGLDNIIAWTDQEINYYDYDDVTELYDELDAIFQNDGRLSLDDILLDQKNDFLEHLEKKIGDNKLEKIFEPKEVKQEPLFLPSEEPFTKEQPTIKQTVERNLTFIEELREKLTLKEIAKQLDINYNTLRGRLSDIRKGKIPK